MSMQCATIERDCDRHIYQFLENLTPCPSQHLNLQRSERQESEAMGGLCQGRPAIYRAFNRMVEEIPGQGRLEGCHRMYAATHLICGLESV